MRVDIGNLWLKPEDMHENDALLRIQALTGGHGLILTNLNGRFTSSQSFPPG